MDDIPNLIKDWPGAVKTHFPGQHTRPGPKSTYYISYYMVVSWNMGTPPKSSILIRCSIINQLFWIAPFLETPISQKDLTPRHLRRSSAKGWPCARCAPPLAARRLSWKSRQLPWKIGKCHRQINYLWPVSGPFSSIFQEMLHQLLVVHPIQRLWAIQDAGIHPSAVSTKTGEHCNIVQTNCGLWRIIPLPDDYMIQNIGDDHSQCLGIPINQPAERDAPAGWG